MGSARRADLHAGLGIRNPRAAPVQLLTHRRCRGRRRCQALGLSCRRSLALLQRCAPGLQRGSLAFIGGRGLLGRARPLLCIADLHTQMTGLSSVSKACRALHAVCQTLLSTVPLVTMAPLRCFAAVACFAEWAIPDYSST